MGHWGLRLRLIYSSNNRIGSLGSLSSSNSMGNSNFDGKGSYLVFNVGDAIFISDMNSQDKVVWYFSQLTGQTMKFEIYVSQLSGQTMKFEIYVSQFSLYFFGYNFLANKWC